MRLVATDLDGTIVRRDGTISARTVAALRACEDTGIDVVYVTGRPPRWLAEVVAQTGHSGTALCANGAVVYDLAAERVLHARTMAPDVVHEVRRRLAAGVPDVAFAVETLAGYRREPAYLPRWDTGAEQVVGSFQELLADQPGVLKVLCRKESGQSDELLAVARELLGGLALPTHSNARDCLVEVSALEVSKAAALAELAGERGIARSDVVAFGDMPNDIEMLAWAGRGYAMAGGHPEAVAAADQVAPSCADDGVAQVIEALLAARVQALRPGG